MTVSKVWHFRPDDTWFFRESRPQGAVGASELASRFPPPARTVAGAVRTAMGEAHGVDWAAFASGDGHAHGLEGLDLVEALGDSHSPGQVAIRGPWLSWNGEPLFSAPALLLKRSSGAGELCRLGIGDTVETDLGRVPLPALPEPGFAPLEGWWLTRAGLESVLEGHVPAASDDHRRLTGDLVAHEPRLGIARDNRRGTVEEGMLYQTRHLRLRSEAGVVAEVAAPDVRLHPSDQRLRFGGEGRLASIRIGDEDSLALPGLPKDFSGAAGLILVLLTDADLDGQWMPPGFEATEVDGRQVWEGRIADVAVTIHAAALGKAVREGGWDVAGHKPRAVRSLLPAGSAWYVTTPDLSPAEAAERLHGQAVGHEQALGRGLVAAGVWPRHECPAEIFQGS